MTDLRDRFRDLDVLEVPDVFERARAIGPKPPMPEPGPSTGRRIAIATFALVVGLAGVYFANEITRGTQQVPGGPVPCPSGHWQQPAVSSVAGSALKVAATSPDDIWTLAAGASSNGSVSILRGRLLHLSGDGWRGLDLPSVPIFDMGDSPSGELWILGRDAAWRLTGGSWTREPLPQRLRVGRAILPFGSDDVWVTGDTADSSPASRVWHWDGAAWSEVALPSLPSGAVIAAMGGTASDDVWAIARYPGGVQPMHWDGSTWAAQPSQTVPRSDDRGVIKIAVSARDDAWLMAGVRLLHWDGAAWTAADPSPSPPPGTSPWADVASGPSGTWFVDGAAGSHGQLQRWDGTQWVPAASAPTDRYLSTEGGAEWARLAVVGNEVVVIHGPYRWIHRNPNGSGEMGAGPITAFTYTCGSA